MTIQMTKERMEAYVEVLEILKHMDNKYVKKIPEKLIAFFERNSSKDYSFSLDNNKTLAEQKLKNKTLAILGMLNLNYWCENEEAKQKLLEKYYKEEKLYQQELSEKYNPDKIFNKQIIKNEIIKNNSNEKETDMIIYKETVFTRIINRIKKFFRNN